jgi:Bifunctional DNA primase/polymerase, N-terminal
LCHCIALEAFIQTRRSLGAAGRGMSPLDIALEYIDRGWSPVPVPHKSKAPLDKGWPAKVVTEENAHRYFNGEAQNIGVRLGGLSGGLADIDLDCAEAIAAAAAFLPGTRTFGRASKRLSHWLFKTDLAATEDVATITFTDTQKPAKVILEIRIGGGGKGGANGLPGFGSPKRGGDRMGGPARGRGNRWQRVEARGCAAGRMCAARPCVSPTRRPARGRDCRRGVLVPARVRGPGHKAVC